MAPNGQPGMSEPRELFEWPDLAVIPVAAWSVFLAYLGGWWAVFVAFYLLCLLGGAYFKISTALHRGQIDGMRYARGPLR